MPVDSTLGDIGAKTVALAVNDAGIELVKLDLSGQVTVATWCGWG